MELEVSAWTRRDRLERIAAAERDRRAGGVDLALAALGDGTEWPARLVRALAVLPEGEGAAARAILESTLDDWAAEAGLQALDPKAEVEAEAIDAFVATEGDDPRVDEVVTVLEEDFVVSRVDRAPAIDVDSEAGLPEAAFVQEASALDAPIEHDELERAFAEAEAQTDEMHGVNDVAERVLMYEPMGLAELSGDVYDATDDDLRTFDDQEDEASAAETDAAWAEAPIWPEPRAAEEPLDAAPSVSPGGANGVSVGPSVAGEGAPAAPRPRRTKVITTLERWLDNIRAGRAQ